MPTAWIERRKTKEGVYADSKAGPWHGFRSHKTGKTHLVSPLKMNTDYFENLATPKEWETRKFLLKIQKENHSAAAKTSKSLAVQFRDSLRDKLAKTNKKKDFLKSYRIQRERMHDNPYGLAVEALNAISNQKVPRSAAIVICSDLLEILLNVEDTSVCGSLDKMSLCKATFLTKWQHRWLRLSPLLHRIKRELFSAIFGDLPGELDLVNGKFPVAFDDLRTAAQFQEISRATYQKIKLDEKPLALRKRSQRFIRNVTSLIHRQIGNKSVGKFMFAAWRKYAQERVMKRLSIINKLGLNKTAARVKSSFLKWKTLVTIKKSNQKDEDNTAKMAQLKALEEAQAKLMKESAERMAMDRKLVDEQLIRQAVLKEMIQELSVQLRVKRDALINLASGKFSDPTLFLCYKDSKPSAGYQDQSELLKTRLRTLNPEDFCLTWVNYIIQEDKRGEQRMRERDSSTKPSDIKTVRTKLGVKKNVSCTNFSSDWNDSFLLIKILACLFHRVDFVDLYLSWEKSTPDDFNVMLLKTLNTLGVNEGGVLSLADLGNLPENPDLIFCWIVSVMSQRKAFGVPYEREKIRELENRIESCFRERCDVIEGHNNLRKIEDLKLRLEFIIPEVNKKIQSISDNHKKMELKIRQCHERAINFWALRKNGRVGCPMDQVGRTTAEKFTNLKTNKISKFLDQDQDISLQIRGLIEVLQRYYFEIKEIFKFYAGMEVDENETNLTMNFNELVKLASETKIISRNFTMTNLTAIFAEVNAGEEENEGEVNPEDELVPEEFVEILFRIALFRYRKRIPPHKKLEKLLESNILRYSALGAREIRRFLLTDGVISGVFEKYQTELMEIFDAYINRDDNALKNDAINLNLWNQMLKKYDPKLNKDLTQMIFSRTQQSDGSAEWMNFNKMIEGLCIVAISYNPDPFLPRLTKIEDFFTGFLSKMTN